MDILIKNMEMPKERKMFVIEPDGSVWIQIADTSYFCTGSKAVALPEHGDLISKASVLYLVRYYCYMREYEKDVRCEDCDNRNACVVRPIMYEVNKLDTVLEATNG